MMDAAYRIVASCHAEVDGVDIGKNVIRHCPSSCSHKSESFGRQPAPPSPSQRPNANSDGKNPPDGQPLPSPKEQPVDDSSFGI
jgi:hypothetical protein